MSQCLNTAPRISIVVTTRNDNHGMYMRERFHMFLKHLSEQCDAHNLNAELVIVEWNPNMNSSSLYEATSWPKGENLDIRIITVPGKIHNIMPVRLRSKKNSPKNPVLCYKDFTQHLNTKGKFGLCRILAHCSPKR